MIILPSMADLEAERLAWRPDGTAWRPPTAEELETERLTGIHDPLEEYRRQRRRRQLLFRMPITEDDENG